MVARTVKGKCSSLDTSYVREKPVEVSTIETLIKVGFGVDIIVHRDSQVRFFKIFISYCKMVIAYWLVEIYFIS